MLVTKDEGTDQGFCLSSTGKAYKLYFKPISFLFVNHSPPRTPRNLSQIFCSSEKFPFRNPFRGGISAMG